MLLSTFQSWPGLRPACQSQSWLRMLQSRITAIGIGVAKELSRYSGADNLCNLSPAGKTRPPFPVACMDAHAAQRKRRPFSDCPVPVREQGFGHILEIIHHIAGSGDAALLADRALHAQVERERKGIRRRHGNAKLAYACAALVARGIDVIAIGP